MLNCNYIYDKRSGNKKLKHLFLNGRKKCFANDRKLIAREKFKNYLYSIFHFLAFADFLHNDDANENHSSKYQLKIFDHFL